MRMKKMISSVLCCIFALSMMGCGSNREKDIPENAAYLVTYSSMFKQDAGFYYVSAAGDILSKSTKLKMQDLSRFEVRNDRIILSGERRNNTVIFTHNSPEPDTDLLFLDNSKYSGVTAIASDGNDILGVMNGNFLNGVYKNLYVLQNLAGEVLKMYQLEIFAHKALYSENEAVIAGAYIETQENSMLTVAELLDCKGEEIKTYKYDEYKGFWDIVRHGDNFYCLAEQKDEKRNTVVIIDAADYSIKAECILPDGLINLLVYNDSVYVVGNAGLYVITPSTGDAERIVEFDGDMRENEAYAYFAYELDGKAYVFLRYRQRQKENRNYIYGNMVEIDLATTGAVVTQIRSSGKNRVDNIFVIPATFWENEK